MQDQVEEIIKRTIRVNPIKTPKALSRAIRDKLEAAGYAIVKKGEIMVQAKYLGTVK